MKEHYDVIIVGTGAAGLYCALNLPEKMKILLITKQEADQSDSFLAQGGICMLRGEDDYENYFEDTMRAGHYENNKRAVDLMIRSSNDIIRDLLRYHVDFARDGLGNLAFTREGAHSQPRILFHEDITGKEITQTLLTAAKIKENIEICEYMTMVDLISKDNTVCGIIAMDRNDQAFPVYSQYVVLACGGIGGLFKNSTNFSHIAGDGVGIAMKHHVEMENLDYIQIHPTTLYSKKPGRRFLVSESVRGEGALLYDKNGQRFTNELQPRDLLSQKIFTQMEKDGTEFVWEDMRPLGEKTILEHFPHIYEQCVEEGFDPRKEPIPVVPAQHYFMGGIKVNLGSKTSMKGLYACGETSCNGVHGRNRLASNSLLESLVFARKAADDMIFGQTPEYVRADAIDMNMYESREELLNACHETVLKEIERMKKVMNSITMKMQADKLIRMALQEDITSEDVSTNAVMRSAVKGTVDLIAKEDGIIAGLDVYARVFQILDEKTEISFNFKDGEAVKKGDLLGTVTGDIRVLLSGERVALNYLQRMSGIATYTKQVSKLLEGSKVTLLDTRKTTPNCRVFEKYAVRIGGGCNHRYNLSDGVLLKDNHIGAAGSVAKAVAMAKEYAPFVRKIEIEVETMEQVKEAVEAGADIIMLDNMTPEMMKEAVELIAGRAQTECSGNITKENIAKILETGVDFVSSGALTHSAPILDISMKNLHAI